MKEYNIVFGDDYKKALANVEADVNTWVETLRTKQEEINAILNNTEKTPEQRDKELQELIETTPQANKDYSVELFKQGLSDKNITGSSADSLVENYSKAYDEAKRIVDNGEVKIAEIIKTHTDENGNITEEGFEKIKDVRTSIGDEIALINSQDFDTQLAQTESFIRDQNAIYGEAGKGTLEGYQNEIHHNTQKNIEKLKSDKEYIDGLSSLTKEQKQEAKNAINEEIANLTNLESAQKNSLNRRALYDEEFAKANGLSTQQINENAWSVIDNQTGVITTFFDSEEALKKYADATCQNTTTITDQWGNTQTVLMDAGGNIIGMVDSVQNQYGLFAGDVNDYMEQYQEAINNGSLTTDQSMARIQQDLLNGVISAEQFGMTDSEFLKVAQEMVNASGDADTLKNNLNNIPKNTNPKVTISGVDEANKKVKNLWASLQDVVGRVWDTAVNITSTVASAVTGKRETGGSVNQSGIYQINEKGVELVDGSSTALASSYMLGSASEGEYAYLSANTHITNAVMTTQKMSGMIDAKLSQAMAVESAKLERALVNALSKSGTNGQTINIDNFNALDKGSEQKNINNIKRIINHLK